MPRLGVKSKAMIERYSRAIVRRPWLTILLSLAVALVLAAGAHKLRFDTEYRVWFGKGNPELQAFEAVQRIYAPNDSILFVVAPKHRNVFRADTLAAIEKLTRAAWKLPFSRRVDSITNFQHTRAEGDELIVADLVKGAAGKAPAELQRLRAIAMAEPELARRLISDRGHVTAVNVVLSFPGKAGDERPRAADAARALRDRVVAAQPNLDIRLTGLAMLDVAFFEAGQRDATTLTPIMIVLVTVGLMLFLRSVSAALATLVVIILSCAAAMGAAGWAGLAVTPPLASAPTIILTLAVADSVHILSTHFRELRAGRSRGDAIVESLRVNIHPVTLTSITTAIGFLSMNFSDAPPFRDLGNVTAFGVIVAFGLSVTLLPALAAVLPVRAKAPADGRPGIFEGLAEFVLRRRRPLFWGVGCVVIVLAALISRIEFDDDFVEYFDRSFAFRNDTDFVTKNLTGLDTLEYSIPAKEKGAIADPDYLRNLERFAVWLRGQPEVVHVSTLTDTMRRINRSMHGDDAAWFKLPDSRRLAAQYLLLYELSLPFGLDLNDRINIDKSATRLVVTLDRLSTNELRAMARRADTWIATTLPAHMRATATGPSIMFARISDRNIRAMFVGTLLALVLISLLLIVAFRSPLFGAISLIPNVLPAIMAFGLWGLLIRQVDVAVSVIAAISLGIVVDDTIHFLSKYLRARREIGASATDAIRYAFSTVGPAIATTTIVLVAGFLVLALSPFAVNSRMGMLTAIAIAFALLLDFLLLPPVLLLVEKLRSGVRKRA